MIERLMDRLCAAVCAARVQGEDRERLELHGREQSVGAAARALQLERLLREQQRKLS